MRIHALMLSALTLALSLGLAAAETPKVSLEAKDLPADKALAQLQKQVPGVDLRATQATKQSVTLSFKEVPLEDALKALAQAVQGSWVRAYIIERKGPGDKPYTAAEYLDYLTAARDAFMERMTAEERAAWIERISKGPRGGINPGGAPKANTPAGGVPAAAGAPPAIQGNATSAPATTTNGAAATTTGSTPPTGAAGAPPPPGGPGGQSGGPGGERRDPWSWDDPVLPFSWLPHSEKISLTLTNANAQAAADQFIFESGYILLLEDGVEGTVTLAEKDQELPAVLDKLAAATEAKWRPFYLLCQPVKLSEAELDKRMEAGFNRGWQHLWSRSPEERAKFIADATERISKIPPEATARIRSNPQMRKMFGRLMTANTKLTTAQRQEFQPLLRALARIMQ